MKKAMVNPPVFSKFLAIFTVVPDLEAPEPFSHALWTSRHCPFACVKRGCRRTTEGEENDLGEFEGDSE